MSIRDDFFAKKASGALWDVAVSIKRGNPLPLDSNSVFESYEKLQEYAQSSLAYPGQVLSVVSVDSTTVYCLDQNLNIQPVGIEFDTLVLNGGTAIDADPDSFK